MLSITSPTLSPQLGSLVRFIRGIIMVLRCLITYYSASCLVSLSCSLAVASSPFLSSTCNRVAVGNLVLGLLGAGGGGAGGGGGGGDGEGGAE